MGSFVMEGVGWHFTGKFAIINFVKCKVLDKW